MAAPLHTKNGVSRVVGQFDCGADRRPMDLFCLRGPIIKEKAPGRLTIRGLSVSGKLGGSNRGRRLQLKGVLLAITCQRAKKSAPVISTKPLIWWSILPPVRSKMPRVQVNEPSRGRTGLWR